VLGFDGPRALSRLRTEGGGPKFQTAGRKVYYRVVDLYDWVEGMPSFSNASQATMYFRNLKTG
jgi:hypothetical protein